MSINSTALTKEKINGRYYTPPHIVELMLGMTGYSDADILQKHVMENSCGDGAFICEIVRRYCSASIKQGVLPQTLASELARYIHGIEIDFNEHKRCIKNADATASEFGVYNVKWDIKCANTLTVDEYRGKMDFVIGNPPYVRVHNLTEYDGVKKYSFAQNGMTDLYIVFYEIGLSMLNESGTLCYINPSSLFNSMAANSARKYLIQETLIKKIVDLKHYQPFDATAYTAITVLSKNNKEKVADYYTYDTIKNTAVYVDKINYADFYINGAYCFADNNSLSGVRKIINHKPKRAEFDVKNGFATLYDDFFIGNLDFNEYTIHIIKASTGQFTKCFFPYDKSGNLMPYEELIKIPSIKRRYELYEEKLKARSLEDPSRWWGFGRSQGITDVLPKKSSKIRKYSINALIRNIRDIKLVECNDCTGVYGGLYILTEMKLDELKKLLFTDEFIDYVSILGKYKSGGYYTYSSKDLLKYLEYKHIEKTGGDYGQIDFLERA